MTRFITARITKSVFFSTTPTVAFRFIFFDTAKRFRSEKSGTQYDYNMLMAFRPSQNFKFTN